MTDGPARPGPPPVRWGVLGATSMVARLAVLPALAASPKCELAAVASQSTDLDQRARWGARRAYRDYQSVLDDPEVEAVYIPLPNSLHLEWTRRAADAGKHVLCEKPLACTAAAAAEMAEACSAGGVALMEAYMTPFHPRSTAVIDLARSDRVGLLQFGHTAFTGRLRRPDDHRWRPEMGGGALLDVGIYCVAPLIEAAGRPPVSVAGSAVVTDGGVDVSFAGWLDFGGGLAGSMCCSFDAPERQHLELVGTQAALSLDRAFTPGPEDTVIQVTDDEGHRQIDCGGADPYRGMVDHFATVLRAGTELRRRPADSIATLRVLDDLAAAAGIERR